jgi:hypothetical protein
MQSWLPIRGCKGGRTRNLDCSGQFCKRGSQTDSGIQEDQAVTSMAIDQSDVQGQEKDVACTHPLFTEYPHSLIKDECIYIPDIYITVWIEFTNPSFLPTVHGFHF